MKTLKLIGNCCLVFLAVIAVCVSLGFFYYHFFVHDKTVGTNYIDNQIGLDVVKADDLTEEQKNEYEERYFLEANFYSNSKNNGIALQEMKLNYFTDYNLLSTGYRSSGMQYLGDLKQSDITWVKTTKQEAMQTETKGFCYYDTTNGINWDGNKLRTQLNKESCFTIKIDDRAFQIQLDKTTIVTEKYGEWYTLGIPVSHKVTLYYNYLNVFADCMQAIRSNSAGFGDYYITVDLSQYFTIREFDKNTGKYKQDDVTDIIKNYSVLKFHYDENGARNSTQSIFNCIDCNPSYDVEDKNVDTTYWQERMVYTLTEENFEYRYSDVYQGYFASLNLDIKKLFADMPRTKVNINLDLTSQYLRDKNLNIIGFEYNGLEDFEIDTLSIIGNNQKFYILDKALYNTKLQTLKHSSSVTLDFADNAINNEFAEVIL